MNPEDQPRFTSPSAPKSSRAGGPAHREPTRTEVLLMFLTMAALHLATVCRAANFWDLVVTRSDSMDYVEVADVIRHWHFGGGPFSQDFWGFPYTIAGASALFSLPEFRRQFSFRFLASLAACILIYRLYGGWVTAVFLFINYEWIRLAVEGGGEPLFMCLLFASFLAARAERWNLASFLAALGTTVRPVGILALMCFAIVLAMRKRFRKLAVITLIGLAVGLVYLLPLWAIYRTPFANFTGYSYDWGPQGGLSRTPFARWFPAFCSPFTISMPAGICWPSSWVGPWSRWGRGGNLAPA